ncbi:MAG: hypothetical protein ABI778_07640, partial [Ignavibacteriota bacterium]
MTKRLLLLITAFLLLSGSVIHAQQPTMNPGAAKFSIEYQWPHNGATFVPQKTTFILRTSRLFMAKHNVRDFV